MNKVLISASGSKREICQLGFPMVGIFGSTHTFSLSKLWVECQVDFRGADTHQFVLVALDVSKIPHKLFEEVIGMRAHELNLRSHKLVN
jgi:hypothetical protein